MKEPGRYGDGGRGSFGLYLRVTKRESGRPGKSFGQRITLAGRRTNLGLGPYPVVTLAEARVTAIENLRAVRQGKDPRAASAPTFEAAAEAVIRLHAKTWKKGSRLPHDWRQSFRHHAFPVIGSRSVAEITTAEVLKVLTVRG